MKVCLRCGDTYRDHVDFCFVDGEVLQTVQADPRAAAGDLAAGVRVAPEAASDPLDDVITVRSDAVTATAPEPASSPSALDAPPSPTLTPVPAKNAPADDLEAHEAHEEAPPEEVVRTRTPEMPGPPPHALVAPAMPPVIQRIEIVRTPTEFARAGDGPTPLEVPRHVVRIEPVPSDDGSSEPGLSSAAALGGAAALFLALGLAFALFFWAYGQGREQAAEPPKAVTGAPGPFLTDPPGAYVFIVGSVVAGERVDGTRYVGKTAWNGARLPVPPAERYTFSVVLDGYCSSIVEWDGRQDGQPLRVELPDPPCGDEDLAPGVDTGGSPL